MLAIIETNGATHIAIYIPKEGADKSLPALAAMLEHNSVFIQKSWKDVTTVTPNMSITLGDTYRPSVDTDCQEVIVSASDSVIDESFVNASPSVFVSNKKAMGKKDEELKRVRSELDFIKQEFAAAKAQINAFLSDNSVDDPA